MGRGRPGEDARTLGARARAKRKPPPLPLSFPRGFQYVARRERSIHANAARTGRKNGGGRDAMTVNRFEHAKKAFAENHKLCSDPNGAPIDRIEYNLYVGLIDLTAGMNEMRTLLFDQVESA